MNQQKFEDLVDAVKSQPIPPCPRSVDDQVLRRVRNERSKSGQPTLTWLSSLLPQPGLIAAMLLIAVGLTSAITVLATKQQVTSARSQLIASAALDFDFFIQKELLDFEDH